MSEVETRFKPFGPCGCGCGKEGNLRVRPWKDGTVCVARGCSCKRCKGKAVRSHGDAAGRKARKALGLGGVRSRHEEVWGGPVRTESKSQGVARPVITAHSNAKNQSEQARPMGDNRPFLGSFTYRNRTVFTVDADDMEAVVFALAEAWGFGEGATA